MNRVRQFDQKLFDLSDRIVDWFWVWFGLVRKDLQRGVVSSWAITTVYRDLWTHQMWAMIITGVLFILLYLHPPHWRDDIFMFFIRGMFIGFIVVDVISVVSLSHKLQPAVSALGNLSYLWFMYLTINSGGKRDKREQRLSLKQLIKLFGSGWIPQPAGK